MASEPVTGWGVDLGCTTIEVVVAETENAETENAGTKNAETENAGTENAETENAETENADTENASIRELWVLAARRLQVLIVAADREARPRCPA